MLGARIQVSGGKKVSWLRYTTCLTTRPDNGVFPWNRNYKKSYFVLSGLKARTVPFYMYMWQMLANKNLFDLVGGEGLKSQFLRKVSWGIASSGSTLFTE